ncbi:type VI secretion system baseplate subunit TssG [Rubrivivax gelatinosus]|nr:type VI secretion system baseplate subunit TssG [Rubrivivax gelatinosus]
MPTATSDRRPAATPIERLFAAPGSHGLYPALRLLQRWLGEHGDELSPRLRCRNSLSLSPPTGEIEALVRHGADSEAGTGVELVPAFGSLLGVHGTLPTLYTELLLERQDPAPGAFLDLFVHRLAALGFRAWRHSRLALRAETPRHDALQRMLLALAGVDAAATEAGCAAAGAIPLACLAFHSAALQTPRASAEAVERVLGHFLAAPVRVRQWISRWYALPPAAQGRLGLRAMALGRDTIAGGRTWQHDLRVRVDVGPLPRPVFETLLPGSAGAAALRNWLALLLGGTIEVELRLVLGACDVPAASLRHQAPSRLGLDTFVLSRPATHDRDDAGYLLFPTPCGAQQ